MVLGKVEKNERRQIQRDTTNEGLSTSSQKMIDIFHVIFSYSFDGKERTLKRKVPHTIGIREGEPLELMEHPDSPDRPLIRAVLLHE